MNPFQVIINNKTIKIGAVLPTIVTHLKIICLLPIPVSKSQSPLIKQWLNTVVDRLECEYVEYNGVLVKVDELTKFEL